jgi:hypothetical protein
MTYKVILVSEEGEMGICSRRKGISAVDLFRFSNVVQAGITYLVLLPRF